MLALLRYTTLRFAMLLAVGFVCYLLGLRDVLLLIVAFLVSGILSLLVLDRQRDALGVSVGGVFARINARIEANSRSEDAEPSSEGQTDGTVNGDGSAARP